MQFILLVGLLATTLAIAPVRFDREKVFRVKPQDENQANIIKDLAKTNKLDFWYPDAGLHVATNMTVDFQVSDKESQSIQSALDQNKMHYEILIHDLQEVIEKQFDVKEDMPGRHSYAKYNSWDKIVAWTEKMVHKCPDMVSRIKIGTTVEDNPLYVLKIGKKDERRKAIFMDCGIHAREWISPAFCQWFVYQATKTYGKNKIMTKLLDQMNFYVLPVFNVDGYIWSWKQNRMWRKNRSKNQNSNCIGTDLNRNFNVSWNAFPTTKDPCKETYPGPEPESEKETKAVTDFIQSHLKSIKAYITIHSYSQMLLFPYGYTSELPPNNEELTRHQVLL
ncbi:mast cell carboxypeptidase A isoform X2 [Desmodus rotundus]|uniref:mast cell carboxypeptidase A isoform X2 n=1 Tax=Desmodus rotundus TaxID=9430 RepID=UPI0023814F8D|nr:mast cell carboxypeptidase A isoform X2 [Desmodus rotundus]